VSEPVDMRDWIGAYASDETRRDTERQFQDEEKRSKREVVE
jgi:hypothetical protein